MPTADQFQAHQQRVEERRAAASNYVRADYFSVDDGEMAQVRFLEQGNDLIFAICHRVKVEGQQFPQDQICLDQNEDGTPCPFCQSPSKDTKARSTKGFVNLIWRGNPELQQFNEQVRAWNNAVATGQAQGQPQREFKLAPVFKRNDQGFLEKDPQGNKILTGFADGVFLWKCSKTVFTMLLEKDSRFKGLMSRDFVVMRKGKTMQDTQYFVEPANPDGGAEPMLVSDMQLAQAKYNLAEITKPRTYEEAMAVLSGAPTGQGPQPTFTRTVPAPDPAGAGVFNPGAPPMRSSAFTRSTPQQ